MYFFYASSSTAYRTNISIRKCVSNWIVFNIFRSFFNLLEWADGKENDDEVNVWEDNWDDDNVEDDFNNQLRAQLESQNK